MRNKLKAVIKFTRDAFFGVFVSAILAEKMLAQFGQMIEEETQGLRAEQDYNKAYWQWPDGQREWIEN